MKKTIISFLATTGLSLVLLAAFIRTQTFDLFFSLAVLQTAGANVVIHLGLLLTRKFESKYLALEMLLDVACTTLVLTAFAFGFGWFTVTPIWVLATMAVLMHVIVFLLSMRRTRNEASAINKLLKNRDEKQEGARKIISLYSKAGSCEGMGQTK